MQILLQRIAEGTFRPLRKYRYNTQKCLPQYLQVQIKLPLKYPDIFLWKFKLNQSIKIQGERVSEQDLG